MALNGRIGLQISCRGLYISCRQIQRSCLDGSIGAVQMALELQCALEKQQMALEKLQRSCKLYYMSYIIEGSREEQQRALGGAVYVFILLQELYMQRVSGLQRSCSPGSREQQMVLEKLQRAQMSSSCRGAVQGFKGAVDGSRGAVHVQAIGLYT